MQKKYTDCLYEAHSELYDESDDAVYLASEVDDLVQQLRSALADIAFSEDMTLEVARAKAKRIYESSES